MKFVWTSSERGNGGRLSVRLEKEARVVLKQLGDLELKDEFRL